MFKLMYLVRPEIAREARRQVCYMSFWILFQDRLSLKILKTARIYRIAATVCTVSISCVNRAQTGHQRDDSEQITIIIGCSWRAGDLFQNGTRTDMMCYCWSWRCDMASTAMPLCRIYVERSRGRTGTGNLPNPTHFRTFHH